MRVQTGLDRIGRDARALIKGRRIGLLAHAASVDTELRHAREIVVEVGAKLQVIFGPEHGFQSTAQDMIGVETQTHCAERIVSLYGDSPLDLQPKREDIEGLDAIVVDLQDVGSRYYTYVWTAALLLRVAAQVGVEVIILDRPNPLGGKVVQGSPQRAGYRSFVGLYPVSVRHGLTIGEMLQWVRQQEGIDEHALRVVKMHGWQRDMYFPDTGLPWVMPSPNMPTFETALVYPGGCVIEGTTLSEGRGTTRPFEIWGAPWMDARTLLSAQVPGAVLRPLSFTPTFQKHRDKLCHGVQVHVRDPGQFCGYASYLRLLAVALQACPEMPWRTEEYEFEKRRPAIDLLTGGPEYRQLVNTNQDLKDYLAEDEKGARVFETERQQVLLYK